MWSVKLIRLLDLALRYAFKLIAGTSSSLTEAVLKTSLLNAVW